MVKFSSFLILFLSGIFYADCPSLLDEKVKVLNKSEYQDLCEYNDKTILIVNTASRCGFTYQYEGLQKLHDKYADKGLVVITVPSNDFNQELKTDAAVQDFCEINYNLTLPMTTITSVKGSTAHPFFQWIREEHGFTPRWNFYKVLLDPEGNVAETYNSITKPTSKKITSKIEEFLGRISS